MNLHYQRYFLQSGLITFFLIVLLCLFFVSDVLHSAKPDAFAMIKSDVISISLDDTPARVSKVMVPPVPLVKKPVEEVEKASDAPSPVVEKVPEIDDLFATVKITKSNQSLLIIQNRPQSLMHSKKRF